VKGALIKPSFGRRDIAMKEVTILLSIDNIKLIFNNGDCLTFLIYHKIIRA
jgi:hypothetical protein